MLSVFNSITLLKFSELSFNFMDRVFFEVMEFSFIQNSLIYIYAEIFEMNEMTVDEIFSECFNIPVSDVNDNIEYKEIEKWDSLNHLRFTAKLEEVFDIDLDMDEITEMSSVKKIREILKRYGVES